LERVVLEADRVVDDVANSATRLLAGYVEIGTQRDPQRAEHAFGSRSLSHRTYSQKLRCSQSVMRWVMTHQADREPASMRAVPSMPGGSKPRSISTFASPRNTLRSFRIVLEGAMLRLCSL